MITSETVVVGAAGTGTSSAGTKESFPAWQTGQSQSGGRSANRVPGGVPVAFSPSSSSYVYPQTWHLHRAIPHTPLIRSIQAVAVI
jgi:hypothetical protein